MARTTPERVRDVIQVDSSIDLTRFIETANALVSYVVTVDSTLPTNLLVAIETYLAAHFYALRDQQLESTQIGEASDRYQTGDKGRGLYATDWGANAVALDPSGVLAGIAEGIKRAGVVWMGKPVNTQIDYEIRN